MIHSCCHVFKEVETLGTASLQISLQIPTFSTPITSKRIPSGINSSQKDLEIAKADEKGKRPRETRNQHGQKNRITEKFSDDGRQK